MTNNSKLTAAVQAVTGQTKAEAEKNIQAVLSSIKNLAVEDKKITIQGFGTFASVTRAARTGRNPQTGASLEIPERQAFTFKASK